MYKKRLLVLINIFAIAMVLCMLRLAWLQLLHSSRYRSVIESLRIKPNVALPTVRGRILDRNDRVLAIDKPVFYLQINYKLLRLLDQRFWQVSIEKYTKDKPSAGHPEQEVFRQYSSDLAAMEEILKKSEELTGASSQELEDNIKQVNDKIWEMRTYFARLREKNDSGKNKNDNEDKNTDWQDEILPTDILKIDLAEMHQYHPVIKLQTPTERIDAQLALADMANVAVLPEPQRTYPYKSAGAQIIGWVGKASQPSEKKLFSDDDYMRYLEGELTGKSGIEKAAEPVLRGRRGAVAYDKDKNLIRRKTTEFGKDVRLTIDIELQQAIETYLSDPNFNTNTAQPVGVVVLDVSTSDILAMVSIPTFDLNSAREHYTSLLEAKNSPLQNRCLAEHYPPGSCTKPLILIMGLEEGKIRSDEIISCPHRSAPAGWPNCLTFRLGSCHDWVWDGRGDNKARNALCGSCNVYFSVLANRIGSERMQQWLYGFGFGHKILTTMKVNPQMEQTLEKQNRSTGLHEVPGQISTTSASAEVRSPDDIGELADYEKKLFGIGQGNFRATVLQVANATATVARWGIFKNPRIFLDENDPLNQTQRDLVISKQTIETVRDGMSEVITNPSGSAYSAFRNSPLLRQGIKIFGKTGSTESPENAWFTCFAEDSSGRSIAIALVVVGGESGGRNAAPLGEEILRICRKFGYIGTGPGD